MVNRVRSIAVLAIVIAIVGALLLSSCAPTIAPQKEIIFGNSLILTGAIADVGVSGSAGQLDYQKWINEHGGINGIPIKSLWRDCGGMFVRSVTNYKWMREREMVVFHDWLSATMETLAPTFQRDEIPAVHEEMFTVRMHTKPVPWIFPWGPGYVSRIATFMKWVKDDWKESRPPRIGVAIYDHPSGWETVEGYKLAPEFGVEPVGYEVIPLLGVVDTSVEILRLMEENPDWIYTLMCGASATTFYMDCYRLGIQQKGTKIFSGLNVPGEVEMRIFGEAAEGCYKSIAFPHSGAEAHESDRNLPGMKDVFEAAQKYRNWGPKELSMTYVCGWLQSMVMVEGARVALEKVGIENITGKAVRDGLASIRAYETGLIPSVTMTNDRFWVVDGWKYYQVQGGQIVPLYDEYIKPAYYPELK